MPINFIPNDPSAPASAPTLRAQAKRPNRPSGRAGFTFSNPAPEGKFAPGTPEFLFWQCREGALAALEAWESVAGKLTAWQGKRKKLSLLQDAGLQLNAFYDRSSFAFFHKPAGGTTFFSGASTDVVAHEIGHGLLDALRPDLWDAAFLETGAFHEAFGDCMAILTALHDRDSRVKLLALTTSLRKKNFVESTAENLSAGIGRMFPTHNAAEPRRAFNTFKFQIPETLPLDGGPGELINEVHSFGMVFTGCFYDLIAEIFAAQTTHTEASLLASARTAGSLLVAGASTAVVTPRFFQAVGRAMMLADDQANGGENRQRIREAFERHDIKLGANALLGATSVLAGGAPRSKRKALSTSTRRDLAARLGLPSGAKFSQGSLELGGQQFSQVVHTQRVPLGSVDKRLKGVSVPAAVPVIVGHSGGHAAVMGEMPESMTTEREVQAFAESLLRHGQIEFLSAKSAKAAAAKGFAAGAGAPNPDAVKPVAWETHRVVSGAKNKTLMRVRFNCGCGR